VEGLLPAGLRPSAIGPQKRSTGAFPVGPRIAIFWPVPPSWFVKFTSPALASPLHWAEVFV